MTYLQRMPMVVVLAIAAVIASDDGATAIFKRKVNEYVALRQEKIAHLPALPKKATPEQITKYEADLATELRTARVNCKEGDVFVAEVQPLFREILKAQLSGSARQAVRDVARQGNPKIGKEAGAANLVVRVNAVYPKNAPLSTVPASLLSRLPTLPETIQYRFVGQTLVLWDSSSRLIIDYIKGAAPAL